jgi:hypothetical protein
MLQALIFIAKFYLAQRRKEDQGQSHRGHRVHRENKICIRLKTRFVSMQFVFTTTVPCDASIKAAVRFRVICQICLFSVYSVAEILFFFAPLRLCAR